MLGADFAVGCAVGLYVSWQVQKTDMPNLHCALDKDFLTPIGRSGIQFSVTLPVVSAVAVAVVDPKASGALNKLREPEVMVGSCRLIQCSLPPIRSLFFEIITSFRFHSFEAERENFWWSNHGTIQISWRSPSRPGQDMADGRHES